MHPFGSVPFPLPFSRNKVAAPVISSFYTKPARPCPAFSPDPSPGLRMARAARCAACANAPGDGFRRFPRSVSSVSRGPRIWPERCASFRRCGHIYNDTYIIRKGARFSAFGPPQCRRPEADILYRRRRSRCAVTHAPDLPDQSCLERFPTYSSFHRRKCSQVLLSNRLLGLSG